MNEKLKMQREDIKNINSIGVLNALNEKINHGQNIRTLHCKRLEASC